MSFLETVERARAFLERDARISLPGLKREFELDDDALDELVDVQRVATREGNVIARGKRRRTLETLAEWLFALTAHQPMVLVVEDLHWADPSSLELLEHLIDQAPTVDARSRASA
ncbi:MAG: AAA family ATPase [Myxococcota bacterium]